MDVWDKRKQIMANTGYQWSDDQLNEMRAMAKNGASLMAVSKKFNVSPDAIKRIAKQKNFLEDFTKLFTGSYLTFEDINIVKSMMDTHTSAEIAQKIGKHRHFVELKIKAIKGKDKPKTVVEKPKYTNKLNLTPDEAREFLKSCSRKIVEPLHERRPFRHENSFV